MRRVVVTVVAGTTSTWSILVPAAFASNTQLTASYIASVLREAFPVDEVVSYSYTDPTILQVMNQALQPIYGGRLSTTLDFPSTAPSSVSDLSVTLRGCLVNDIVTIGPPALPGGVIVYGFVAVANGITVRFCNLGAAPVDPGPQTYIVTWRKA